MTLILLSCYHTIWFQQQARWIIYILIIICYSQKSNGMLDDDDSLDVINTKEVFVLSEITLFVRAAIMGSAMLLENVQDGVPVGGRKCVSCGSGELWKNLHFFISAPRKLIEKHRQKCFPSSLTESNSYRQFSS